MHVTEKGIILNWIEMGEQSVICPHSNREDEVPQLVADMLMPVANTWVDFVV